MNSVFRFVSVMFVLMAFLSILGCSHSTKVPEMTPESAAVESEQRPSLVVPVQIDTVISDRSYKLGPEDKLSIDIRGQGGYEVRVDVMIQPNGAVALPMVGEVKVSGLTLPELEEKVTGLLEADYLVSPRVSASLELRRSHVVTLVGEINEAGTYYLQAETELLRDVIFRAGGPKGGFGKTVFLIRPPTSAQPGDEPQSSERHTASLLDLMTSPQHPDNIPVKSGDLIYVLSGDAAAEFAGAERRTVLVFGEVGSPGIVPYSRGLTVLRAILKAGNFGQGAAKSRVLVKRTVNNEVITIKVDINRIIERGDKSADIELMPGDVVYVPRSIF